LTLEGEKLVRRPILVLIMLAVALPAAGQLAPNAPRDKPVGLEEAQFAAFERAIAPHVAKARATYPEARERYLRGLPTGHTFFVTTRLYDEQGRWEQAFIQVTGIANGKIHGRIASQLTLVTNLENGQKYSFPEADLLDWMVARPDGSEEGNVVGKFLDTYRP
jgi:uncharacterized protein YegJ (DUF2314 family)